MQKQRQKRAAAVVALMLMLGSWVSLGFAHEIESDESRRRGKRVVREVPYDVPTPAPDGQVDCFLRVLAQYTSRGTRPAMLNIEVSASPGGGEIEADIGDAGTPGVIGAGIQPGCDILINSPSASQVSIPPNTSFDELLPILLHAHPGPVCTVGSQAVGAIKLTLRCPTRRCNLEVGPLTCGSAE